MGLNFDNFTKQMLESGFVAIYAGIYKKLQEDLPEYDVVPHSIPTIIVVKPPWTELKTSILILTDRFDVIFGGFCVEGCVEYKSLEWAGYVRKLDYADPNSVEGVIKAIRGFYDPLRK